MNVDTARCASTRAAFIGLPASAEMMRAASSWRSSSSCGRPVEDPCALVCGQRRCSARSAASSARRASAAPPAAIRPTSSPEYGERTSVQSPVSTCCPSIRSAWSVVLAAIDDSTLMLRGAGAYGLARRWRGARRLQR